MALFSAIDHFPCLQLLCCFSFCFVRTCVPAYGRRHPYSTLHGYFGHCWCRWVKENIRPLAPYVNKHWINNKTAYLWKHVNNLYSLRCTNRHILFHFFLYRHTYIFFCFLRLLVSLFLWDNVSYIVFVKTLYFFVSRDFGFAIFFSLSLFFKAANY